MQVPLMPKGNYVQVPSMPVVQVPYMPKGKHACLLAGTG